MQLKLSVVESAAGPFAEDTTVIFGKEGGTIGRASDNKDTFPHLRLADNYVSSIHAVISYESGVYFLTDQSANGTDISNNATHKRVFLHKQKVQLDDGDNLTIGDFKIAVSIEPVSGASGFENTFAEELPAWLPPEESLGGEPFSTNIPSFSSSLPASSRKTGFTDGLESSGIPEVFSLEEIFGSSLSPQTDKINIETNIDAGAGVPVADVTVGANNVAAEEPPPVATSSVPVAPINRDADFLKSFWEGAGIIDEPEVAAEQMPAIMHLLGEVFREMVDGLMLALKARAEQRNVMRASMTHIGRSENNPLKFKPQAEAAIKNMLLQDDPGFIAAVDAVREGFADLKNDQLAMHAGVQAVLTHTLEKFSPDCFAAKFKEGLVLQKKAKYWNEYCERYPIIRNHVLENFFNEIFVQAFEEQVAKLRTYGAEGQDKKYF
ncbi:MAG: type VI secretion system-associated FHA domain protein TagH [Deltaproteobacteria bacterium]|nr:type VI secretion system-associated FHA domain protein TagH [Candidatus Tharpella sp.]